MAFWWKEKDIRKLAENEAAEILAGDRGQLAIHKHIKCLIRDNGLNALSSEFNTTAERIVEDAKASLQGKLNAVYRAQTERLEKRLKQFEQDLEAKTPSFQKRLSELEGTLNEVSSRYQNWLEEPKQKINSLIADCLADFKSDLEKVSKDFEQKTEEVAKDIESRTNKVIQNKLHDFVVSAVREHVRSASFDMDRLSNKQLAKARGISLRAVKRERRK